MGGTGSEGAAAAGASTPAGNARKLVVRVSTPFYGLGVGTKLHGPAAQRARNTVAQRRLAGMDARPRGVERGTGVEAERKRGSGLPSGPALRGSVVVSAMRLRVRFV